MYELTQFIADGYLTVQRSGRVNMMSSANVQIEAHNIFVEANDVHVKVAVSALITFIETHGSKGYAYLLKNYEELQKLSTLD